MSKKTRAEQFQEYLATAQCDFCDRDFDRKCGVTLDVTNKSGHYVNGEVHPIPLLAAGLPVYTWQNKAIHKDCDDDWCIWYTYEAKARAAALSPQQRARKRELLRGIRTTTQWAAR